MFKAISYLVSTLVYLLFDLNVVFATLIAWANIIFGVGAIVVGELAKPPNPSYYSMALTCFISSYIISSPATFWLYFRDKQAAKVGKWRTSEARLHYLELVGGWIAAFIAQKVFRHKNKKASYQLTYNLIVIFHLSCWVTLFSLFYPLPVPRFYLYLTNILILLITLGTFSAKNER
jgi:uncharacterized membrane protein YsdA (DUF1294 family)